MTPHPFDPPMVVAGLKNVSFEIDGQGGKRKTMNRGDRRYEDIEEAQRGGLSCYRTWELRIECRLASVLTKACSRC